MSRDILSSMAMLVAVLFLSGCGLTHQYGEVVADLRMTGSEHVVVGVVDNRPYIVSGNKEPSFVGLMRSGVGIPYDVHTASKKAFAQEVGETACRSLIRSGFRCAPEVFSPSNGDAALAQAMSRQSASKGLLFVVSEWKVDTYVGTALWYDMQVAVRDRDSQTLASSSVRGKDVLGSSLVAPAVVATEEAPKSLRQKLEEIMNDRSVSSALMK